MLKQCTDKFKQLRPGRRDSYVREDFLKDEKSKGTFIRRQSDGVTTCQNWYTDLGPSSVGMNEKVSKELGVFSQRKSDLCVQVSFTGLYDEFI